jgi:hypothetical protein
MAQRLTLSTVGIKSPLDVGDGDEQRDEPPARPTPRRQQRRPRPPAEASLRSERPVTVAPFYGTGRPLQTSIALDDDCAARLDELARAAGVSANALAVAALHAGLPAAADAVCAAIVDERVGRAGIRGARIERNLRLPEHLRARIDELTFAARGQLPRATRADLINAALRGGLPADAELAAELVAAHARRVELAAAA